MDTCSFVFTNVSGHAEDGIYEYINFLNQKYNYERSQLGTSRRTTFNERWIIDRHFNNISNQRFFIYLTHTHTHAHTHTISVFHLFILPPIRFIYLCMYIIFLLLPIRFLLLYIFCISSVSLCLTQRFPADSIYIYRYWI